MFPFENGDLPLTCDRWPEGTDPEKLGGCGWRVSMGKCAVEKEYEWSIGRCGTYIKYIISIYIYYLNINTHQLDISLYAYMWVVWRQSGRISIGNKLPGYLILLQNVTVPKFSLRSFPFWDGIFSKAILLALSMYHVSSRHFCVSGIWSTRLCSFIWSNYI